MVLNWQVLQILSALGFCLITLLAVRYAMVHRKN